MYAEFPHFFTFIITKLSSIQSKMNFLSFQDTKADYVLKPCSFLQEIQVFTSSMLDLHYFYATFANFHSKSYKKMFVQCAGILIAKIKYKVITYYMNKRCAIYRYKYMQISLIGNVPITDFLCKQYRYIYLHIFQVLNV